MWDKIVDWYLTRKTGYTKEERAFNTWYEQTVNYRAGTIEEMFANFKYVFHVDPDKFLVYHMLTEPKDDISEYRYPKRELGNNLLWTIQRGEQDRWDGRFHITNFSGEDRVYLATNNHEDAIMLALKYG